MRLIDAANALKSLLCRCCKLLQKDGACEPSECSVLAIIDEQPAVEAAPVVRCEDCNYCDPENKRCRHPMSTILPIPKKPDDFCSHGERRNET